MKIVGVLVFRDEEPYLRYAMASLRELVDEVMAMDDRSVDRGPELLRDLGATVLEAPRDANFGDRRAAALQAARRVGGTHLVLLDADEAFTYQFARTGRAYIERLKPGEALSFPFRTLWRGATHYRVGREYNIPLSSIFRDDGIVRYPRASIHESRTPRGLTHTRMDPEEGSMVHFQFTAWNRAQVKQAWYRCREFLDGRSPTAINARYLSTLDSSFVRTLPLEPGSLSHLPPVELLAQLQPSWHLAEVMGWMDQYGPARFEPLQIWHVPELARAFHDAEDRCPRSQRILPLGARSLGDVYGKVRAGARRLVYRAKSTGLAL